MKFKIGFLVVIAGLIFAWAGALHAANDNVRLLNGALRQASRGDTATALQVIDRYLVQPGRDPAKAYALFLKGMLLDGRGETDSAETYLRESIVAYPSSEWLGQCLVRLGLILSRESRDTAAVRVLQPAVAAFADSSFTLPAMIGLGRSAVRAGLEGQALDAYLQYLRSEKNGEFLIPALQRSAELLVARGRGEEALRLLGRLSVENKKTLGEQELPVQIVAIGALIGVGMPDSALRVVEEIRRTSGDSPLGSPRLVYLIGRAHLAQDDLSSADSVLTRLTGNNNLIQDGVRPDSLYRLLMEIGLRRGDQREYFRRAVNLIELERDSDRAFEQLEWLVGIGEHSNLLDMVRPALLSYVSRFGEAENAAGLALIRSRFALTEAGADSAMALLEQAGRAGGSPETVARITLARSVLYLGSGDTLRAEALIREYLTAAGDPLHIRDSLLYSYSEIKGGSGEVERERQLLQRLVDSFPASRFWERADNRLEEIRLFESARPLEAANELLDLFIQHAGQVPPARLAEIAANKLEDYERAWAIIQRENPSDPAGRLRLIRYKFLSALNLRRNGAFEGGERLAQAWREIRTLLATEKEFSGREMALETYLQILQRIGPTLPAGEINQASVELIDELAGLEPGLARAEILDWLAGRYLARAEADTAMAALELADSARAMWTEAVEIAGGGLVGARCTYRLAMSLEEGMFAGARDSAASLYEKLAGRPESGRWGSLAGLRLGVIHLNQERHFLAYRTISLWGEQNSYAVRDIGYRTALTEASFLTGRYSRAVSLMDELNPGELDTPTRRRFDAYRIRALVAMGDYGQAVSRLVSFRDNYREPESERIAAVLAAELYYAAGSPELAESYRERLKGIPGYEELAALFSLQALLARGGDEKALERLRKEFEDLRDAPWNPFLKIDIAFQAYRGIAACYATAGELDKVADTRDSFRRKYPERRAALAVLMLDEIDNNLDRGRLQQAVSLNDDLNLLFADVCPEDRLLWVDWKLAQARSDVTEANRRLSVLADKYPWSVYGQLARVELIGLNISADRVDSARALLESVEDGAELRPDQRLGAMAAIAGAQNQWQQALDLRRRQWAESGQDDDRDRTVLDWAEAALRAGRVSEALEVLSAFWSGEPTLNAEARLSLAEQYRAAGYNDRALTALDGAVSSVGERSEQALQVLYRQGMLLEEMGRMQQALETYRKLEQMAGQNSDWLRSARNRIRELESRSGVDSASQAVSP